MFSRRCKSVSAGDPLQAPSVPCLSDCRSADRYDAVYPLAQDRHSIWCALHWWLETIFRRLDISWVRVPRTIPQKDQIGTFPQKIHSASA